MQVELTEALVEAAQLNRANPSPDAASLLALELRSAAELCQTPVEAFLEFAAQHEVPLHYGTADLEADRLTLQRLQQLRLFPTPHR